MGTVAYSIRDAAEAAAVDVLDVEIAIKAGELTAHRVGAKAVVLASDIQSWLEHMPEWVATCGRGE